MIKLIFKSSIILYLTISVLFSEEINDIKIDGNNRISNETVKIFIDQYLNDKSFNLETTNNVIKSLYETGFFKDVKVKYQNNVIYISVIENPLIQMLEYEGIKSKSFLEKITSNLTLKPKSSFNEFFLERDKNLIIQNLKNEGYYFSEVIVKTELLDNNFINIFFEIELGDKSKISKISFIGDKIFKDRKLKNIIISEEYKPWKFLSGKKYLNERIIAFDQRLLKNFYLNNGYYNVEISSSFAKLLNENEFELIYNINPNEKIFFGELFLDLPADFNLENFEKVNTYFNDIKGKPYSINSIQKILEIIEETSIYEEYQSIKASVNEKIDNNKINLTFVLEETPKLFVKKINIFGNNVTNENVIRNKLFIDEGDPFNEILYNRSINEIKSLNYFRNVNSEILDEDNAKIINIYVEEKPTGEISAGAGFGTSGATVLFQVRENNYLGKGIGLNTEAEINEESIKGSISLIDPNYKNSDKSAFMSIKANETDRLKDFGYKSNVLGFSLGTNFDYKDDLRLGVEYENLFENMETDSTASILQQRQKGNYYDNFLILDFDYDKRNRRFQTNDGFRSNYDIKVPLISKTNTFTQNYNFKTFHEFYENNITTFSYSISATNSLSGDNVKLSERLYIPSKKLRGFERGKVGPKDGNSFIGGNYSGSFNFTTTLPLILDDVQNFDGLFFVDAANLWGVDYDSSVNKSNKIRSSVGVGLDWLTPVGPLSFSLATPLTKADTDIEETFRFNLGTTF
jgi:outer membrane protein insertion porin family